jgi:hypothetical protein
MKTLFEITEYNVDRDCNVLCVDLSTEHRCHIPLTQFEKWLQRTDRLSWVHDWSDHDGEHCQETGEYSTEQYWEMSTAFIKHDIYEFIVIHFVSDAFKDIKDSITKITHEYAR